MGMAEDGGRMKRADTSLSGASTEYDSEVEQGGEEEEEVECFGARDEVRRPASEKRSKGPSLLSILFGALLVLNIVVYDLRGHYEWFTGDQDNLHLGFSKDENIRNSLEETLTWMMQIFGFLPLAVKLTLNVAAVLFPTTFGGKLAQKMRRGMLFEWVLAACSAGGASNTVLCRVIFLYFFRQWLLSLATALFSRLRKPRVRAATLALMASLYVSTLLYHVSFNTFTDRTTGRSRILVTSRNIEVATGIAHFSKFNESALHQSTPHAKLVREIGERLAMVTGTFDRFADRRDTRRTQKAYDSKAPFMWPWEFIVLDNDEVNAFALQGGKVVVHKGLVNGLAGVCLEKDSKTYATDACLRDALAFVIGHEIGHCELRHLHETSALHDIFLLPMYEALEVLTGLDFVSASFFLSFNPIISFFPHLDPKAWFDSLISLSDRAFSRQHEYEADTTGAYLSAAACFNARKGAGTVFRLLEQGENGLKYDKYFSTHPSNKDRKIALKALFKSDDFAMGIGACKAAKMCETCRTKKDNAECSFTCRSLDKLTRFPYLVHTELNVSKYVFAILAFQVLVSFFALFALASPKNSFVHNQLRHWNQKGRQALKKLKSLRQSSSELKKVLVEMSLADAQKVLESDHFLQVCDRVRHPVRLRPHAHADICDKCEERSDFTMRNAGAEEPYDECLSCFESETKNILTGFIRRLVDNAKENGRCAMESDDLKTAFEIFSNAKSGLRSCNAFANNFRMGPQEDLRKELAFCAITLDSNISLALFKLGRWSAASSVAKRGVAVMEKNLWLLQDPVYSDLRPKLLLRSAQANFRGGELDRAQSDLMSFDATTTDGHALNPTARKLQHLLNQATQVKYEHRAMLHQLKDEIQ